MEIKWRIPKNSEGWVLGKRQSEGRKDRKKKEKKKRLNT